MWPTIKLEIELNSGRKIKLESIKQRQTYEGFLCGIPTKETNKGTIEFAMGEYSKDEYEQLNCVLVEPAAKPISYAGSGLAAEEHEILPAIMCVGRFTSSRLPAEGDTEFTHLKLVWFQDEFGIQPDQSALEQIKKVDWDKYAQEQSI